MKSLLVFITFLAHTNVYALIHETPNLNDCLSLAGNETTKHASESIFFVFDIDNTVLALNQNLGSIQWFRWQQKLINGDIKQDRVADTVLELLDKQLQIYQLSKSSPPELSIPIQLKHLQAKGHPVMFHTSRNTDVRDITERELQKNNLIPLKITIGPKGGYPGRFTYSHEPNEQRLVSFQNGIYMTAGQDKGLWLLNLFNKTNEFPKHVVFVDDEVQNLQNVERALERKIPTTLCRYGNMDNIVNAFNKSDKKLEIDLWNDISRILSKFN